MIKNYTDVPIIMGGAHVSAVKEQILENSLIDFGMYGESEKCFVEFIEEYSSKKRFERIGNLIWRGSDGSVRVNEPAEFITDLDSLPFPDFSVFGFERYNYAKNKTLPIITSRGCPYKCNYCSVNLSMGRRFRKRSAENVVEEMKYWIKKHGIKKFEVNDDCFTLDMRRAENICEKIIEEGLNITYELYNGIRADRVSERLLAKMKKSGCIFISYGCESGNQGIINNMGKALELNKVTDAVKLTNKMGIQNSVNFMIGHQGEIYQNALETIKFAKTLPTNFVNFYNVVPYPGTRLYEWMKKESKQLIPDKEYLSGIGSRDAEPVFETKTFTRQQRIDAYKKGNALYERTILEFRFGKIAGFIFYLVARNRRLFKLGRRFALENTLGFKIYSMITRRNK
jgi:anaerobic magnesium-protoporphyrin IX monomethyl ester cyclase